jgi:aspartyl-tRNA(Asn)/glutamyl-tRNA(Gln) amidotransferase subunit A
MTRSVRDGILAHEIMAYRKVPRFDRSLSAYTMGVPSALMLDHMSQPVSLAWERSLKVLARAGAKLVDIPLAPIVDLAPLLATGGFSAAESYTWHRHLMDAAAADYDPRVVQRIARGAHMKAHEYLDLQKGRTKWIGRMTHAMQGLDVLLSPTLPITGPTISSVAPGAERDEAFFASNALLLRNTSVVNMLDGCALSLPCHRPGELPVSLMVWQGPMTDDVVLNASLAIENALNTSS